MKEINSRNIRFCFVENFCHIGALFSSREYYNKANTDHLFINIITGSFESSFKVLSIIEIVRSFGT